MKLKHRLNRRVLSPLDQTQTLRQLYVQNFPNMPASSQGEPSEFAELQQDDRHTIRWNRPASAASSIPCTLLHPIFGQFIDDCENSEPTAADNKLVWKLSTEMSRWLEDETARASMFREILRDSDIHASATTIEGTKYTTEGDIQSHSFRLAIIEAKKEIGAKGPEPHAQGISYYIHSTKSSVTTRPGFRFPCILITLFGKPRSLSLRFSHGLFRCPYRLLGRCLEHSSERTGAFDCLTPLFASHRHQAMQDDRPSF
jgi:hypothetical protein